MGQYFDDGVRKRAIKRINADISREHSVISHVLEKGIKLALCNILIYAMLPCCWFLFLIFLALTFLIIRFVAVYYIFCRCIYMYVIITIIITAIILLYLT